MEHDEKVCDFCLKSQSQVMIIFSSKNNKFHVCDYCIENMFHEMMQYLRQSAAENSNETNQLSRDQ